MTDTRMIHLALSPNAAQALEDFITGGGQPQDARAGHPKVIDSILAELKAQRAGLAPATPVVAGAQQIAQQMAAAGAAAVTKGTAA